MDLNLPKILKDKDVTILAGGPSLEGFDFSLVKQPVIAVNSAAYFAKSNILVSLDKDWHKANGRFLDNYEGYLVTDRETHRKEAFIIRYDTPNKAGSLDWTMKKNNLSGFIALAVALNLGAGKVFLLGFDGGFNGEKANYYENPKPGNDHEYSRNNDLFDIFKENNIINVGLDSRIEAFRKVPLNTNFYLS